MRFLFPLLLGFCSLTTLFAQGIDIKDGETVVFLGNSITHGGSYHEHVQQFFATRYPGRKVRFLNRGISGDTADDILQRLDVEVLNEDPDYVFLMVGMNDVRRDLYHARPVGGDTLALRQAALDAYYANTTTLAQRLDSAGARLVFLLPSIYDQTAALEQYNNFGVNDALGKAATHMRGLAARYGAPVVDFYGRMNTVNAAGQFADPGFTIVGRDRVHPGEAGHFLMATELIAAVFSPGLRPVPTVIATNDPFTWHLRAGALPFYVRAELRALLPATALPATINQQPLRLDVSAGNYLLVLDSDTLGMYTGKQLAEGIVLPGEVGADYRKAAAIAEAAKTQRERQRALRTLPYVDLRLLRGYTVPDDWEAKQAVLDEIAEGARDKPWYQYWLNIMAEYKAGKPREAELRAAVEAARDALYAIGGPERQTLRLIEQ